MDNKSENGSKLKMVLLPVIVTGLFGLAVAILNREKPSEPAPVPPEGVKVTIVNEPPQSPKKEEPGKVQVPPMPPPVPPAPPKPSLRYLDSMIASGNAVPQAVGDVSDYNQWREGCLIFLKSDTSFRNAQLLFEQQVPELKNLQWERVKVCSESGMKVLKTLRPLCR